MRSDAEDEGDTRTDQALPGLRGPGEIVMTAAETYIALALLVLAIIAFAAVYTGKSKRPKHPPSKLAMVAILLVISAVVFGENRYIRYSLLGAGVLLSILDIFRNRTRES